MMTTLASEEFDTRHKEIKAKLMAIELPDTNVTNVLAGIGVSLNITGQTVKNYLNGDIKDGYLAEAIYKEFKRLKIAK